MKSPAPRWSPSEDDLPEVALAGEAAGIPTGAGVVAVYGAYAAPEPGAPCPAPDHLPSGVGAAVDPSRFDATAGELISGYDEAQPWIVAGLGAAGTAEIDSGFGSGLAAGARAVTLKPSSVVWQVPPNLPDSAFAGFVQGLLAGLHRPDRFQSDRPAPVGRVVVVDREDRRPLLADTIAIARACQHARNIQNAPANVLTPRTFAAHAEQLAARFEHVTATIVDEEEIVARGMGAFASVARGSDEPARLIELRYEPPGARGPLVAFVGKGVTFDSGGTNLKRGTGIQEMKFDMSGAAAVVEAVGAIAELGLPVRIIAVAGATENMPGPHATRPGDIVRAANGVTIEVTNTDAEGRLVLADCLDHARRAGAERIVDIATLTGSVVTLFGGRYGALMSNDDSWAATVEHAGRASGDWVWRIPLDPFYASRIRGRYADIVNSRVDNDAGTILAGEFLRRFVGDTPWAHVDALAWDLPHQPGLEGGAAYGVRLLVEVTRALASEGPGPQTASAPAPGAVG